MGTWQSHSDWNVFYDSVEACPPFLHQSNDCILLEPSPFQKCHFTLSVCDCAVKNAKRFETQFKGQIAPSACFDRRNRRKNEEETERMTKHEQLNDDEGSNGIDKAICAHSKSYFFRSFFLLSQEKKDLIDIRGR